MGRTHPDVRRPVGQRDAHGAAVAAADDGHGERLAHGARGDGAAHVRHVLHLATVDRDDDVAPAADVPRGGDIIVAIDGREVEDMADVSRAVSSRAVGESMAVTVIRDGARRTVRVTLTDRPADVGVNPAAP